MRETWGAQSSPARQIGTALLSTAVGLLLVVGFRHLDAGGPNARAGFALGLLLLAIGVAGFVTGGRQRVTIDPRERRITIEDSGRFATKRRTIEFSEVLGVGVGSLGKRSSYVMQHYLVLTLRGGEKLSLFAPGRFFPGASDRSTVEGWRSRLEQDLAE